ncbi:polysaccharide pyruvyl transferase family protein [Acinetobacter towneri]|uniref:polysaccharide pyruvyl transferase family protein n=1 Tax=Acinetobacter towneri TaxID=202956 RepID=UPI00336BEB30
MKKVAILTQPLGHNYGGLMQAWALQQVLKRLGWDVVTIDRQWNKKTALYLLARLVYRTISTLLGKRKALVFMEKAEPIIYQYTRSFLANHIVMSEPVYSTSQLLKYFEEAKYDAVVVGSDQTWRPKYSPCIENFYLDFLKENKLKKIAYASSFGVDEWEYSPVQTKTCAELARLFDAVSVREDSGVDLCKKYLGIDAEHVLDPTLLLTKEDYRKLIGEEKLSQNHSGIYTYILDKTSDKEKFIHKIADQLNESVFNCQAKTKLADSKSVEDCIMPDPKDWLAGFANAKYVITDSFHGMVYSIIFNKPFVVIGNKARGMTRFTSLLEKLNLCDRLIFDSKADYELNNNINWDDVELLKKAQIKYSMQYLEKALKCQP